MAPASARLFLVSAVLGLLPGLARAHDADLIYVKAKPGDAPEVLVEAVTLTAATLGALAPVDADGDGVLTQADLDGKRAAIRAGVWDDMPLLAAGQRCELLETRAWLREGFVELEGGWRCGPGELRQDFRLLRVLPANYRVVLGSQVDGEQGGRGFAQGSLTVVPLPRPAPPGAWEPARFTQGFEAGLRRALGVDVLAAWLALLLAAGGWRRGLALVALALGAALAGAWVDLGPVGPTLLLALLAVGCAAPRQPPLVLGPLLGACVATRGGGGPWPLAAGQGLGVGLVLLLSAPPGLAAGVLLARRPRASVGVRALAAVVAVGAAIHLLVRG